MSSKTENLIKHRPIGDELTAIAQRFIETTDPAIVKLHQLYDPISVQTYLAGAEWAQKWIDGTDVDGGSSLVNEMRKVAERGRFSYSIMIRIPDSLSQYVGSVRMSHIGATDTIRKWAAENNMRTSITERQTPASSYTVHLTWKKP